VVDHTDATLESYVSAIVSNQADSCDVVSIVLERSVGFYFEATASGVESVAMLSGRGFAQVNICWKRSLET
jgi:hypothetical protein